MELAAALDRFWAAADARRLGIDTIQVVTDDGPHAERHRIDDIRRDVFSVSKTVTSLAIGMLETDGALNLDDPVLMHLPELADTAAPGSEKITVGHLLRMTAGNAYRWADDDADHPGDPARDFLATPLVAEPGSTYHYRGANTYLLSRIVHSISGRDLRDFLVPRLFAPLGIRNPQWNRCPLGYPLGAIGLQLRTSEITRIAQLLLHEGTHDGQRVIPAAYVTRMTADTTDTGRAEPDTRPTAPPSASPRTTRDRPRRSSTAYGNTSSPP